MRVNRSGLVENNEVRGARSQGIVAPRNATVVLTGNASCGNASCGNASCDNGEDLFLPDGMSALAIEHGAQLCSGNRDFGRFAGFDRTNPLAD